jgi:hypothetical protein
LISLRGAEAPLFHVTARGVLARRTAFQVCCETSGNRLQEALWVTGLFIPVNGIHGKRR